MFHPKIEIHFISKTVGRGVFAHEFIPKGTIMYVDDPLDLAIPIDFPLLKDPRYRQYILTYSYLSEDASHLRMSMDLAKYTNHHCNANTLCTSYGFEICVRDIHPGDQVTADYGQIDVLFDILDCQCGAPGCRKRITHKDFDILFPSWEARVTDALQQISRVNQPLLPFVKPEEYAAVIECIQTGQAFRSLASLKVAPHNWREILGQ